MGKLVSFDESSSEYQPSILGAFILPLNKVDIKILQGGMEVTIIVQHLTLNLDGGAILLLGLFLLFIILLVRKYK